MSVIVICVQSPSPFTAPAIGLAVIIKVLLSSSTSIDSSKWPFSVVSCIPKSENVSVYSRLSTKYCSCLLAASKSAAAASALEERLHTQYNLAVLLRLKSLQ